MRKQKWEELVSEQASSGESQVSYCRRVGVTVRTFQYHRKRLREVREAKGSGSFVRVGEERMEVELRTGVVVRIPARVEFLKMLLEVRDARG